MRRQLYLGGVAMMVCASVSFSLMATLVRYVSHIDPFKTSLFRFAVGLALLGILVALKKIELTFIRSKLLFLRGFFGGMAVLLFYFSIGKIGIAKGTVILYSSPIFAAIGGVVFLKEKVSRVKWCIILSAFCGIFLISGSSAKGVWGIGLYEALAIVGALCAGIAVVTVKKLRDTDSSYTIFFAQSAIGFLIVLFPANLFTFEIDLSSGIILSAIGITAAIGQLLMTYAFRHLPVSTGVLIGMLVPVFNIPIGVIGFNEDLSGGCIAGILLVIGSCALLLRKEGMRQPLS